MYKCIGMWKPKNTSRKDEDEGRKKVAPDQRKRIVMTSKSIQSGTESNIFERILFLVIFSMLFHEFKRKAFNRESCTV